jgi:hypothetical protein
MAGGGIAGSEINDDIPPFDAGLEIIPDNNTERAETESFADVFSDEWMILLFNGAYQFDPIRLGDKAGNTPPHTAAGSGYNGLDHKMDLAT